MAIWFFSWPIDGMDHINWFSSVEPALHTSNRSQLGVVYNLFYILLESTYNILLEIFAFMVSKGIDLHFSFLKNYKCLSDFGSRIMMVSWTELGNVPFVSIFLEKIIENLYKVFIKCSQEFANTTIWTWYFHIWKFINYWLSFLFSFKIYSLKKFQGYSTVLTVVTIL
jgi:hypothetical protein